MKRRALLAAAACACLLAAAPASAGTLDSYPVVSAAAADKLCGYANATGHATQCVTEQTIANLSVSTAGGSNGQVQVNNSGAFAGISTTGTGNAVLATSPTLITPNLGTPSAINLANATGFPLGGSSGQLQWNNAGAFGGAAGFVYCATCVGGGSALAVNTALNIVPFSGGSLNLLNQGGSIAALLTNMGTTGAELSLNTTSTVTWGNTVALSYDSSGNLDLGSGAVGDKTGQLNLAYLNANTQIDLPPASLCNGTISTTLDTHCVPELFRGPVPEGTLTAGEGKIFIDSSTHYLLAAHTMNATAGLAIQGEVSATCSNTSGMGFCWNSDLTLNTSTGIPVAAVESQGNWFAIGIQRALPCPTQADQGCATQGTDYISQLIINDAVAGGSLAEPLEIYQSGDLVGGLIGFGHAAPATLGSLPSYTQGILRLGAVQDFNTPWDDITADQPDLGLGGGCLSLGTQNGSQTVNSGGLGVTWHERFCDNAGVATLYNTAKSATQPIAVSFVRQTPVTVAGLVTADPSPVDGDSTYVTDATSGSCALNTAIVGGSSVHCRVHYDGSSSSWKAG